ncbi:CHAT domain-containing protein [Streptomyces sp. NPDC006283]|uniref:CHAT domain-containing protein n=1 Tax=Streptomyces sp. NPDC006283 TaxID=3156741 RepID=UPI0033B91906
MFVTTVDVVAIGHTGGEPYALRSMLAEYGTDVRVLPVGAPSHLAEVLNGTLSRAEHLVFSCHGDQRGMLMDPLAPEIAAQQPFNDVLTAEVVTELGCSPPREVVLSTGCMTGTDALARAFLNGGCSAYIAPQGYPEGAAALAFASAFYYQALACGASRPDAVAGARGLGRDTEMFRLWA